jgi:ABC-2 type transport system ATP-binding protein
MTPLRVTDACKSFGEVQALVGVSLALEEGELLALLGPNGAGKTTLVRAIAGRVRLDSGTVELFGVPLAGRAPAGLGIVPQEIAMYPLLSARENLEVFGRFNGVEGRGLDQAVGWALEWTGLGGRAREPIKRFSGGMKRRLNIACGVLHKPRVVLLDEPTVGVDPQSRERIFEMLAELRRGGAALLLTTHQLDEAEQRADRVIIQDHGRVVGAGTVAGLTAEVLGTRRELTLTLDRLPEGGIAGLASGHDPGVVSADLADIERELPALLERIRAVGATVLDLEVRRPSLAGVFLKLTGRELRE